MYPLAATLAFLLVLAHSGQAFAAGSDVKEPAFGSRKEYKACLDFQERLQEQRKVLDDHVAENNNTIALLQEDAKTLAEVHKKVSPFDESQVNEFNRQTEEHNAKVAAANEQAERVKSEYAAYHKESVEYNKSCAMLVVKLDDRDAVLEERSKDGKAVPASATALKADQ